MTFIFLALIMATNPLLAATNNEAECIAIVSKKAKGQCNLSGLSLQSAKTVLQAAVNANPNLNQNLSTEWEERRAGDVFKGMTGLDSKKPVFIDHNHNFTN